MQVGSEGESPHQLCALCKPAGTSPGNSTPQPSWSTRGETLMPTFMAGCRDMPQCVHAHKQHIVHGDTHVHEAYTLSAHVCVHDITFSCTCVQVSLLHSDLHTVSVCLLSLISACVSTHGADTYMYLCAHTRCSYTYVHTLGVYTCVCAHIIYTFIPLHMCVSFIPAHVHVCVDILFPAPLLKPKALPA